MSDAPDAAAIVEAAADTATKMWMRHWYFT